MLSIYVYYLLSQVTSVACLSSLVTSGTAKLGLSALPHFAKLRLILFVSLASALFSLLLIFLNISHLHALIPMDYSKMVRDNQVLCNDILIDETLFLSANNNLPAADGWLLVRLITSCLDHRHLQL